MVQKKQIAWCLQSATRSQPIRHLVIQHICVYQELIEMTKQLFLEKIVYLLLPFLVTFLNVQSVLINKSHLTAPAVWYAIWILLQLHQ